MRKLVSGAICAGVLAAGVMLLSGCKPKKPVAVQMTEEPSAGISSVVHVADPKTSAQMIKGFHDLEHNSWRWTMGQFAVTLRTPAGAAQKGAKLTLKFSAPDPLIERLKSVTLSAKVNGVALPAETYAKTGDHEYSKDVPASAFTSDAVTVEFALEKCLPAGSVDKRELGVVATSVGFETK
jgi:hypothetical protein